MSLDDGRLLILLAAAGLAVTGVVRRQSGSPGIVRTRGRGDQGSIIRFRATETPAAAGYAAIGLTAPHHSGFELEGELDAWAKQMDPGGYAMTPGEDWNVIDVVLPSVSMEAKIDGKPLNRIRKRVEGREGNVFQTWTWNRYSREEIDEMGSRGVVRRGRKGGPSPSARLLKMRYRAALERLRDKDTDSVKDALRLFGSHFAPAGRHHGDLPAVPLAEEADAFEEAFPSSGDRWMIRRAITVLGDEGIHGADEAIEHLRKALHLGDDFEEHG